MAAAAFVATVPDLDLLPGILLGDPVRFHHGLTHSILFATLVAFAASRLGWDDDSAPMRRFWLLCVAALSHPALDLFNYEISEPVATALATQRLFWPLPTLVWPIARFFPSAPIPPDWRRWFTSDLFRIVVRELVFGVIVLAATWRLPGRIGAPAPAVSGAGAGS